MPHEFYKFLHLLSLLGLLVISSFGLFYRLYVGFLMEKQRKTFVLWYMVWLALFLFSGFALLHKLSLIKPADIPPPIWIKIIVWLLLGIYPSILVRTSLAKVKLYSYVFVFFIIVNMFLGLFWRQL
ncbi:MAG: hypothetical protein NZO16_06855 [Deltaproteobacteria bacterium]|nr:hypothetical protein [Deltaproteobacteria bacterium]